jgi:hypothetical protein
VERLRSDWDESDELQQARSLLETVLAENEHLKNDLRAATKHRPSNEHMTQYARNIHTIEALNLFTKARTEYKGRRFDKALEKINASILLDSELPLSYDLRLRILSTMGKNALAIQSAMDVRAS